MSHKLKITAVSGGAGQPSRTLTIIEEIIKRLDKQIPIELHLIELGQISSLLGAAGTRDALPEPIKKDIEAIETADLLIVGTPVYRGSYTGLFKHLFDLVHHEALIDVPVILSATGGSDRHALIIEHQLRPLFGFFQALTLPIGVYATEAEFVNYQVASKALEARLDLAVEKALPHLKHRNLVPEQASPVINHQDLAKA
ncbi:FMN reductase [Methylobacter sp. S3L5C]|uniref:FMN reductase n=1 Tax=Methylobacter sp. S3L5C TaxID=2839024 RepID=UPI001FACC266|nr:FMN reductase [Methylobacter sp. S3L5C]UOA08138.1 FMN reductase [Methylobacter sp. S3L5C]